MNESKMKLLCSVFVRNIDTYIICEKQLYPLVTLFKFISNRIAISQNKKILKMLRENFYKCYTYRKLVILMVLSNNYDILHKIINSNENKIIHLVYKYTSYCRDYDIYYGNTKYSFKELNIKYLEYINEHFM